MKFPQRVVIISSILTLFIISLVVNRCVVSRSTKSHSLVTSTTKPSFSYVNHGSRFENKIALTFDADMTPYMLSQLNSGKVRSWYNSRIVDILQQEKVPATIFMTGMWVETYPEIAKKLANDPLFEIANHSYSHPGFTPKCFQLPSIPIWGRVGEYQKSQQAIQKATGLTPIYFRYPGGCHSQEDLDMASKNNLTVVGWDVASGDSFNQNSEEIINTVKTHTQNGSIILFHFHGNQNAPKTAQVLPEVISYLHQRGFQFVKLSELALEP